MSEAQRVSRRARLFWYTETSAELAKASSHVQTGSEHVSAADCIS
jgi:hypothetical protein